MNRATVTSEKTKGITMLSERMATSDKVIQADRALAMRPQANPQMTSDKVIQADRALAMRHQTHTQIVGFSGEQRMADSQYHTAGRNHAGSASKVYSQKSSRCPSKVQRIRFSQETRLPPYVTQPASPPPHAQRRNKDFGFL
ncbi:hypothetical protein RRG08_008134 [Elysia crispata]|uniref:Uncharacterized protein n=1 Tax=Elysia crispata TaxID=231223 RepID=A0AAE1DA22_9GAST|nr:hypothetical protein RRG08_008134 [Elysia crispata]